MLACQRLIGTVVNQRMRWRLRAVQATFMSAPVLLLVPRGLLIFVPAGWYLSRRLLKSASQKFIEKLYAMEKLAPLVEEEPGRAQRGGGLDGGEVGAEELREGHGRDQRWTMLRRRGGDQRSR